MPGARDESDRVPVLKEITVMGQNLQHRVISAMKTEQRGLWEHRARDTIKYRESSRYKMLVEKDRMLYEFKGREISSSRADLQRYYEAR